MRRALLSLPLLVLYGLGTTIGAGIYALTGAVAATAGMLSVLSFVGAALLAGRAIGGLGLLVTGRISAELAYKASRAGLVYIATPSVPSTLAVDIAKRSGMILVGRAVSGQPQQHGVADDR